MTSRAVEVSFVVCTHNGGDRVVRVVHDLVRRTKAYNAETLVVDNASDDGAVNNISSSSGVRVVREEKIGLAHARRAGLSAARGEIVVFVDDDNILLDGWAETLVHVFADDPTVAACGGYGIACLPPIAVPSWFSHWHRIFAVGSQAESGSDVSSSTRHLWGAGLAVRKSAVAELFAHGFRFRTSGRTGSRLLSGEDSELCFALRLRGWSLRYEPQLVFLHLLTESRFDSRYLIRLHAGFGASSVMLDPYDYALGNVDTFPTRRHRGFVWQAAIALRTTLFPRRVVRQEPTFPEPFVAAKYRGRLVQLLRMGRAYDRSFSEILDAPWRQAR
jgi:glycosyltransferase involved in cell wall biosynthesis